MKYSCNCFTMISVVHNSMHFTYYVIIASTYLYSFSGIAYVKEINENLNLLDN